MVDPDLLEIRQAFAIEGAELLADMESALLALGGNPSAEDEFARLFRTVHTIKGSASIVRFEEIESFCHAIEHILVSIREHTLTLSLQLVALLLKCHDHISAMMEQYSAGVDENIEIVLPPLHAALCDELQEWSGIVPEELLTYGMLDDSYLDTPSESDHSGFNLFENADEIQPQLNQQAASVDDTAGAVHEKNSRNLRSLRVDAARIDELSDLVVELVTASSVMEAHVRRLGDLSSTESALHVADLIKQIQEKTMSFRMIPVQTLFQRFHRIIHDTGNSRGKQIQLEINGGETELDKAVAEKLHEPLLHLVRNAIDHGIETAEQRTACGKPPVGTVRLNAFHDSGAIIIRVGDDGQGINIDNVVRKAIEQGLVKVDALPVGTEVLRYIFEPGFSTLEEVTMLSGRGVGMDVVRKTVESLRGRIDVETHEGVGTTFQISIPLSLSLVEGFMVSLGTSFYILPMNLVQETLELPDAGRRAAMPNGSLQVRDKLLPCLDLRKVLGIRETSPQVQHVVVFKHGDAGVGLIVDQLHGEIKTVIKPLGRLYRNVTCISGAGILGDGSIALFLETGKLVDVSLAR
ncbi:MAG: chemotaxis protein CheA [Desulfuromonadaceae bacterium]|nr:chemotaxis protein CheA [Desulfuromonadaceae bacterium]